MTMNDELSHAGKNCTDISERTVRLSLYTRPTSPIMPSSSSTSSSASEAMLSFALKNVVLFILIVLIVHFLLKNAVAERRLISGNSSNPDVRNDDDADADAAVRDRNRIRNRNRNRNNKNSDLGGGAACDKKIPVDRSKQTRGTTESQAEWNDDDELYNYVFSGEEEALSSLDDAKITSGTVHSSSSGQNAGAPSPSPSPPAPAPVPVAATSGTHSASIPQGYAGLSPSSLEDSAMNGGAALMGGLRCANAFGEDYTQAFA